MITADQLLTHAVGDYVLQSDWMANQKTKSWLPAIVHVLTYTPLFLFFTTSPLALAVIGVSHLLIDHWRLARFVIWVRNWVGIPDWSPEDYGGSYPLWKTVNKPWAECKATGFQPDRPVWLTTWLLIFTDNIMHVIINGAAIRWL